MYAPDEDENVWVDFNAREELDWLEGSAVDVIFDECAWEMCVACNGAGTITSSSAVSGGDDLAWTCQECDGAGEVRTDYDLEEDADD